MCKHCGELYLCHTKKHGISNLKNHLERCKPYLEKKSKSQTHITFEGGDVNKMMAWKFDQNKSKRALAHMIVVDELPFSFVRNSGFRHFQRINQPEFDILCRGTITKECLTMYQEEKNKLRETLQKNIGRVSLTTDGWTSGKQKSYMALTAHFIDNEWNLVKKVLNFRKLDGHHGIDIGKRGNGCNIRCAAHVINLIVQDGMKKVDNSIEGIRCAVKWIKKSGTRIEKFIKCTQSARCDSTKSLILDCPTRWNSTYAMLEVAHVYEDAFARYDLEDVDFGNHIRSNGHSVPTSNDWTKAKKLLYFAFVLDPKNKTTFMEYIKEDDYGREGLSAVTKKISYIKDELKLFFKNYVCIHAPSSTTFSTFSKRQRTTDTSDEPDHRDMLRRRMKRGQSSNSSISELDKYVGEVCEPFDKSVHFDILQCTSGRVLDSYRSSLGDKTIECLICTQDWLRVGLNPEKEEDMDTIAQIEKALMEQEGTSSKHV
ncbi:zinc finger BED domain-containing protein RICESLEEPER 2-like protein [Tanacetum coccineum]